MVKYLLFYAIADMYVFNNFRLLFADMKFRIKSWSLELKEAHAD